MRNQPATGGRARLLVILGRLMAIATAVLAGAAVLAYASTGTVGDIVDKLGPSDRIARPTSEGETWTESSRRTPEA
jgi:hypothetical protein